MIDGLFDDQKFLFLPEILLETTHDFCDAARQSLEAIRELTDEADSAQMRRQFHPEITLMRTQFASFRRFKFRVRAFAFCLALLSAPAWCSDGLPVRNSVNVKFYPLPVLLKVFALDVDFGAWNSVTLGPTLASFHYTDVSQTLDLNAGWLGMRAGFTFGRSRFTDAWFLGTSIAGAQVKATSTVTVGNQPIDVEATLRASLFGLFGGYQWFWDSGFNLSLGGGFYSIGLKQEATLSGTTSSGATIELPVNLPARSRGALPWVELGLGWVF